MTTIELDQVTSFYFYIPVRHYGFPPNRWQRTGAEY